MAVPVLRVQHLSYQVGGVDLVHGCSLEAFAKDRIVLQGPSGSGRSTICRLLSRRIPSFLARSIRLSSASYYAGVVTPDPLDVPTTSYIGPVPQRQLIAAQVRDLFPHVSPATAQRTLTQLLLPAQFFSKDIFTLSSGEAARVALAVTLHSTAPVTVLDDPWNWIDSESRLPLAKYFYRTLPSAAIVESSSAFSQSAVDWVTQTVNLRDRTQTVSRLSSLANTKPCYARPATGSRSTIAGACRLEALGSRFELGIDPLSITYGRLHWITGNNGTGKTTFARALAGLLDHPGHMLVDGHQGFSRTGYIFGRFPLADLVKTTSVRRLINSPVADSVFQTLAGGLLTLRDPASWAYNSCLSILAAAVIHISMGHSLLVIDEPFSDATIAEAELMTTILRNWSAATNTAILVISHLPSLPRVTGEAEIHFSATISVEEKTRVRRASCMMRSEEALEPACFST